MASRSFAEEAATVEQDLGDDLAHLLQSPQGDWLPAYAYVQGKVGLQIDFWIRSGDHDGHFDHYVMLLQRAPGPDLKLLQVGFLDAAGFHSPELRLLALTDGHESREERPMFVFVGEGSETGEDVRAWAVRSFVWLAKIEESKDTGMEPVDLPIPLLALSIADLVRRLDIEYWKGIAAGGGKAVGFDQDPNQVVKSGTEVLDVIPGDGAPFQWRLLDNAESPECLRRLHVYLGDESVGLGFAIEKGPDLGVEGVEMCFRSLHLGDASS